MKKYKRYLCIATAAMMLFLTGCGTELYELTEEEEPEDQEPESNDNLTIGLLITASVLCVAIIGVMIYWLENFL